MKVSVDIECTPEEARRFMGLPDMSVVHAAYLDKMTRAIDEGVTPDMLQSVMRTWAPMGEAGMGMWKQLLDQIGSPGKS